MTRTLFLLTTLLLIAGCNASSDEEAQLQAEIDALQRDLDSMAIDMQEGFVETDSLRRRLEADQSEADSLRARVEANQREIDAMLGQ
ncbi:MAG: hypothetical protein R3284_11795 [Rubricoccaceae bacterium]|nr:hypothetical protein [Rubricoccaceae bacterium]